MTDSHDDDTATTSRGRRQAAREKARLARQRQKRRARGARWAVIGGIGLVVVALVVGIVVVVASSIPSNGPAPANMANDGIAIGAGLKAVSADSQGGVTASPTATASTGPSSSPSASAPAKATPKPSASATPAPAPTSTTGTTGGQTVKITVYLDYLCPVCGQFEKANNDYIEGLVRSGAATVEYHPIAILNNQSLGTKYSQRAANAGACVADHSPDSYFAFNTAMFANQPEEGTKGLTDAQLVSLVKGLDGVEHVKAIQRCITDETFGSWVTDATQRALKGPIQGASIKKVTGTPTVLVNGQQYKYSTPFTTDEFSNFVVTAAGNSYADTATSTATPEPLPSNSKIGTPAK